MVMQRTANPSIPVRFRSRPPLLIAGIILIRGVRFFVRVQPLRLWTTRPVACMGLRKMRQWSAF